MKKIRIIAMLFIATLVLVSCQNEDTLDTDTVSKEKYPEIAAKLQKMNFSAEGLEIVDRELPDGTKQQMFEVEDDILLSKEYIENAKEFTDVKHYRTSGSTVWWSWWLGYRTIRVLGYTGGAFGLSTKGKIGLKLAVNNYNALNLRLKFVLSYGTNFGPQDIVVYNSPNMTGLGGYSGFPSNGNPHKWISVWGLNPMSYNFSELVMSHHIGHTIGMHHTVPSSSSCGEVLPSVGTIHILGTPWGAVPFSVFNPCYPFNTTGEFVYYDKVALNYMY